jgi:hypothetical protein
MPRGWESGLLGRMVRIPKVDYKTFLIERKFPGFARITASTGTARLCNPANSRKGSSITSSSDQKSKKPPSKGKTDPGQRMSKYVATVQRYRAELEKLTDDELRRLYEDERKKKLAEEDKERFFNQPSADADFDYWSKMAHWTLDEAVALSFGKSPAVVNKKSLSSMQTWLSPFAEEYNKTLELANRAIPWKKLFDPVLPTLFIKWAKDNKIPIPDELVEKVVSRSGALVDWKKMYDELLEKNNNNVQIANDIISNKDAEIAGLVAQAPLKKALGTREKDTLLKLVIVMAVAGYGYDPKAKRSPIPQQIADDLAERGMPMDVDTVRKWLKEAAELLPSLPNDESG